MTRQSALALALAVLAATAYGVASVLQATAVTMGPPGTSLVRRPRYLAGVLCDGAAWLLSLAALRHLPLFVVQSVLSGSLAVTAVLAHLALRARLVRADVAAILLLVAALGVLAAAGGHQVASGVGRPVTAALLAGVPVLLALAVTLRRTGPVALACLSGLAFSGAALGARVVHGSPAALVLEPVSYAVLVYGALGAYAYAQALDGGAVTAVTAVLWSVEVVVPTVVGVTALGDAVRAGWGPAALLAVLAVLASSVVLATRADVRTPAA